MDEGGYREWLIESGQAPATVSTRISDIRRIAKHFGNLDEAWESDNFASILSQLQYSSDDQAQDKPNPSPIEIDGNLYESLSNYRSVLTSFGKFKASQVKNEQSLADKIRAHIVVHHFHPARSPKAGREQKAHVSVRAGDAHDALNLEHRHPAVCGALRSQKLQDLADVELTKHEGPENGPNAVFTFQLLPEKKLTKEQALHILKDRFGEPFNATDKMLSFGTQGGLHLALSNDHEGAKIWLEAAFAQVPPGLKAKVYEPAEGRHSNLPQRLKNEPNATFKAQGFPKTVIATFPSSPTELLVLLDGYRPQERSLDRGELEKLKAKFLRRYADFGPEGFSSSKGTYWVEERAYKQRLINAFGALLTQRSGLSGIELGAKALDLLLDKDAGLLGWRSINELQALRVSYGDAIHGATGALVTSDSAPGRAADQFLDVVWPLILREQDASLPFRDSRTLPSMLLALARPADAVGINTSPFYSVYKRLTGEVPFGNNRFTVEEYARSIEFAQTLFDVMRDDWGWQPRDLWDVQGFIWGVTRDDPAVDHDNYWLLNSRVPGAFEREDVVSSGHWRIDQASTAEADLLGKMNVGDPVALKTTFNQRDDIPFDNHGHRVAVMTIDARGQITAIDEDGLGATIKWEAGYKPRTWYHYTHIKKIWRLEPGAGPFSDALIDFVFRDGSQDLDWFHAHEFWKDRFGADAPIAEGKAHATMIPENLILFGPPGTGKTYRTIAEAVRLCDGLTSGDALLTDPEHRPALKDRYDALRKARRIGFVTFHQSFSYEDFVEGLRPSTSTEEGEASQGGFSLKPEAGVFKQIANRAAQLRKAARDDGNSFDGKKVFKMSLGEVANPEDDYLYDEAMEEGVLLLGDESGVDWSQPGNSSPAEMIASFKERHPEQEPPSTRSGLITHGHAFVNRMSEGDLVVISKGNLQFRAIGEITGPAEFKPREEDDYPWRRSVNWLWRDDDGQPYELIKEKRFSQASAYELSQNDVRLEDIARLVSGEEGGEAAVSDVEPYVLIIDEINRANISKVFGELITLLEPDKRLGAEHELTVSLPYSKESFGVPSNLHVVGTMNTADRSIALLDTALRRRFKFEEMLPNTELLEGALEDIALDQVLATLNQRIEYLAGRDHQIGHAYFMGCETREHLDQTMREKVIPLLQEYFFEDWSKLAAVLGDTDGKRFLEKQTLSAPPGLEDLADGDRVRWSVRASFSDDAYDDLV